MCKQEAAVCAQCAQPREAAVCFANADKSSTKLPDQHPHYSLNGKIAPVPGLLAILGQNFWDKFVHKFVP